MFIVEDWPWLECALRTPIPSPAGEARVLARDGTPDDGAGGADVAHGASVRSFKRDGPTVSNIRNRIRTERLRHG